MEVEPDEEGALWPAGFWAMTRQRIGPVGDPANPTSIRFSDFGNDDELDRIEPAEERHVTSIAGRYRSDATQTEVTVVPSGDDLWFHSTGPFGSTSSPLEFLGDGSWRTNSLRVTFVGGILTFEEGGSGFRFTSNTNRRAPFRRID